MNPGARSAPEDYGPLSIANTKEVLKNPAREVRRDFAPFYWKYKWDLNESGRAKRAGEFWTPFLLQIQRTSWEIRRAKRAVSPFFIQNTKGILINPAREARRVFSPPSLEIQRES